MNKLILFLILIGIDCFSQTVLIEPKGITKSKSTTTLQDFLLTGYSGRTFLMGKFKDTINTNFDNLRNLFSINGSGFAASQFVNDYSAKINFKAFENYSTSDLNGALGFYSTPNNSVANANNLNKGLFVGNGLELGSEDLLYGLRVKAQSDRTLSIILSNSSTSSTSYLSKNQDGGANFYNLGGNGFFMYTLGKTLFRAKTLNFKNANATTLMSVFNSGKLFLLTGGTTSDASGLLVSSGVSGVSGSSNVVFEDDASHYLSLNAPNAFQTGIAFGKPLKGARSGGIVYTGNADMEFRVNGNLTRMTISKAGNVGIRGPLPVAKFHIGAGSSVPAPVISSDRPMVIESALNNEIVLAAPDANTSSIIFSRPSNNANIAYDSNGNLSFNSGTAKQTYTANGNMGFGLFNASSPQAKVHVDGDFALKKRKSIFGATNHHNLDRQGCSIITVANLAAGGGAEAITGLADGVDGLILHIYPIQGTSITLAHQNASSVAANRIITHTANNVIISNRGGATMIYDASVSKWRLVSISN